VTGDLEHDATVRILQTDPSSPDGSQTMQSLVIPDHTSSGVLPVTYLPNDLDDPAKRPVAALTAYPLTGIETGQYIGGATVIDDDPTPALTLRTGAHRITAGEHATWTVTLDKPVDYEPFVQAKPVKTGDGPQLRVGDLSKHFRDRYLGGGATLATPLYQTGASFYFPIRQGRVSHTFSIPTRKGLGVVRTLSLRFLIPPFELAHDVRTVKVRP
jgi:hypothetical protein